MKRQGLAVRLTVGGVLAACVAVVLQAQRPTFRASADAIPVDVQVLTRDGSPILTLTPDLFEVSLGGRRRSVTSAELIRYDRTPTPRVGNTPPETGSTAPSVSDRPRTFVIAIDLWSFDVATSRGMITAARNFVERLQASDNVGLVAYPDGPSLNPTTNHSTLLAALDKVVGVRQAPPSNRFRLSFAEIVDGGGAAFRRICQKMDPSCVRELEQEVRMQVHYYEAMATQSLGTLREILRGLSRLEGRKTLVLLSGGMAVSDRPGRRPDVGNFGVVLGQEAARGNIGIYTLYADWRFLDSFSASSQSATTSQLRESHIASIWLDQFSGTAGGKLFTVAAGNGSFAFDRILEETSSYYLLGLQPEPSDRDGKPKRLSVKVKSSGASVRARTWVVLPVAPASSPNGQ